MRCNATIRKLSQSSEVTALTTDSTLPTLPGSSTPSLEARCSRPPYSRAGTLWPLPAQGSILWNAQLRYWRRLSTRPIWWKVYPYISSPTDVLSFDRIQRRIWKGTCLYMYVKYVLGLLLDRAWVQCERWLRNVWVGCEDIIIYTQYNIWH